MNGHKVFVSTIKYINGHCIPVNREILNLFYQVLTRIGDPDWRDVKL